MKQITGQEALIILAEMKNRLTLDGFPPLSGVDLSGANLYGVDLSGADLRDADLYGVDLSGANLYGVDLRGANLRGANLRGAELDYPLGMSEYNRRAVKVYGQDLWKLGCFAGTTAETIARLQTHKEGRALRSYLSNMLMMLCDDALPAETEKLIADALLSAIDDVESVGL